MEPISIRYESIHGRQEESDISPTSTRIDLSMRGITSIDLSQVTSCPALEILDLSRNRLKNIDLSPLHSMRSLAQLKLKNNKIQEIDLGPLKKLTNLQEIDLSQNPLPAINITPIIQQTCVVLDEGAIVEVDYTLRYLLGGRDSTRISLCNSKGIEIERSPRMFWKKYDEIKPARGWESLKELILYFINGIDSRNWFRLQKGIMEGFGIDELAGFDGNPRKLIESIPDYVNYHSIRNAVYDRVIECLEKQIESGGPTLFLDVRKMSGTRASKLVPIVVTAREEEMKKVVVYVGGNRVNLLPLWLTHYGLELLSVLKFGLTTDRQGLELITRNLEQLGHTLQTEQVELDKTEVYPNISEGLIDYIYSIASMN